ncbi:hypothetical protein [Paraburkholderia youngii]|uniref:hypothetical protein n=1 Tax=Paraburkholderia youngii TaxID=2782701 RepID=UPI003D1B50E9
MRASDCLGVTAGARRLSFADARHSRSNQTSNGIEMRAGLAIAFLKRILLGNAVLCFATGQIRCKISSGFCYGNTRIDAAKRTRLFLSVTLVSPVFMQTT